MTNHKFQIGVRGIFFILAFGFLLHGTSVQGTSLPQNQQKVLSGKNEILSIKLVTLDMNRGELEIEYYYNGGSGQFVILKVEIPTPETSYGPAETILGTAGVVPGRHTTRAHLPRFGVHIKNKFQSKSVKVSIVQPTPYGPIGRNDKLVISRTFDYVINWPSSDPFSLASNEPSEIDRLYKLCMQSIDVRSNLDGVKRGLEQILLANPEYVPAYVELARYQLIANPGPDGLAQAEQMLNTALRIDQKHANSLVLISHVYTLQRRYKEAEIAIRKADKTGTDNIWLYTNWGVVLMHEGKRNEAIEKFQKAIGAPPSLKTYERARHDAYIHLLTIFEADKRWKEADTLYQQRIATYPDNGCHKTDYALFRLAKYGDFDNAISFGSKALEQQCREQYVDERLVLAMAYYMKWSNLLAAGSDTRSAEQYFNRGYALFSDMPKLLFSLARASRTATVIPTLKRRGIAVDAPDHEGMSALALSILNRDIDAMEMLVRHGANVNQRLGPEGVTPLMLAAASGDKNIVAKLLKSNADRWIRTRSGMTAADIALKSGHREISSLLTGRSNI